MKYEVQKANQQTQQKCSNKAHAWSLVLLPLGPILVPRAHVFNASVGPPSEMRRRALGTRMRSGPGRQDPGYHVGHVAKSRQKLIIFSQNVLKCSCNTELIPEKLVLCSINDLF